MEGASRSAQEAEARALGEERGGQDSTGDQAVPGVEALFTSAIFANPSPCLIWTLPPPTPTPEAGDPRHRVSAAWAEGLGGRTGRRVQPGTLVPVSLSRRAAGCKILGLAWDP